MKAKWGKFSTQASRISVKSTSSTRSRSHSKASISSPSDASDSDLEKTEEEVKAEQEKLAKIMIGHLNITQEEFNKNKAVPKLWFQHPHQLLSIFTDLEDENLKLIQECREEEGNLEKIRTSVREVSY